MSDIQLNYDIATDEVSSFKNFGNFTNNVDSFGNYQLVFSAAQSVNGNVNYVKVPLKTFIYNDQKIIDAYKCLGPNLTKYYTEILFKR